MTWVVFSINNKGGTGKSTIAIEMARAGKERGHDIGIMDADIDSANLATKLGCDKKIEFEGDHIIKPVEHEEMKVYSMENAFQESTFSQSGEFFKQVIDNMVNHSKWGELDYMIVDCPPGSSDVFAELIRAFRPSMLGAISVGQPDAVDDTVRLVKVCNHNWIPILGFIENMSGLVCHDKQITCPGGSQDEIFNADEEIESHEVYPFGEGAIEEFVERVDGNFLGKIPLCVGDTRIRKHDNGVIKSAWDAIEGAEQPRMPEDNTGQPSFIKNVWNIVNDGVKELNDAYDIDMIQEKFGVQGREPLVLKLELSDAGALSKRILDSIVLTVDDGSLKPMREKNAKRKGYNIEAGIRITSQDLYDSLRGEKEVMRAVDGEVMSEQYSITKAVKMGDAEIWGERTVNRLAILDKILTEVIDMDEVRQAIN